MDPQASKLFEIAGEVVTIGLPTTGVVFVTSQWFAHSASAAIGQATVIVVGPRRSSTRMSPT